MRVLLAHIMLFGLASPVVAGGFVCDMTFECQGNLGCQDVSYSPYIDTDWGQTVMKDFGPEITLEAIPSDSNSAAWKLYAHLPQDGLFIVLINEDSSAVFTSYLRQGGSTRVVSTFGTCDSRG